MGQESRECTQDRIVMVFGQGGQETTGLMNSSSHFKNVNQDNYSLLQFIVYFKITEGSLSSQCIEMVNI